MNIDTTTVTADGPQFTLESLTVGGFSINRADLATGGVTAIDESGNFNTTWAAPQISPAPVSEFDLNKYLAKNDTAGSTGAGPSDPGDPANPIDIVTFGRDIGVTAGNWKGTNGADPDFFFYESVPDAQLVPQGGDLIDVSAILPGGVIGVPVFLPFTGEWGDTGVNNQGGPNNNQSITGLAISVTDLLDDSGSNLATDAELEGLRVFTAGGDLNLIAATRNASPLELDVDTATGEVSIRNPNATTYTLGLNYYQLNSPSSSLRNDTWSSLDEQEGADDPGDGWEESDASFPPGASPGDFNEDGVVDAIDYAVWREGLGSGFTAADLDLWKANYGGAGGGSGTSTGLLLELRNDGVTEIGPNATLSLGAAFDVTGSQDVTFTYGVEDGFLVTGVVNYVGGAGAISTPEPAAGPLCALLGVVLAGLRRRSWQVAEHSQAPSSQSGVARQRAVRLHGIVVLIVGLAVCGLATSQSLAQVIIYDGDEVFTNGTNGKFIDGASVDLASVLPGAGQWFRTGGDRILDNITTGAAGSATGVDGEYLGWHIDDPLLYNPFAGGAVYVLRDNMQTTGVRNVSFDYYFNQPGGTGSIAMRVVGITSNGSDAEPWDGSIEVEGGAGGFGANAAAGQYRIGNSNAGGNPAPDGTYLELWGSQPGDAIASTSWQSASLDVDYGAGYEWLVFGFAGARQNPADASPADVFGFDNIVVDAEITGGDPIPVLTVDRTTGVISLTNNFDSDLQVISYSIGSPGGGLDSAGWTPVSGRLDAAGNGGDGSFDPDSGWTVSASTSGELSEAADAGDGGLLGMASSVGLGAAWAISPIQDLEFSFQLDGGAVQNGIVSYTGDAPTLGDFNLNGTLDKGDFAILAANSQVNLSGASAVDAYFAGDIDLDGDNDFDDFQAFRRAFITENGAAAFEALLAGVPEPSTAGLVIAALSLAGGSRASSRMRKRLA